MLLNFRFTKQEPIIAAASADSTHMETPRSLKEWELNKKAFDGLLNSLSSDRDQAAEIYQEIRRKLTTFFEFRRCQFPQEQVDETINRVARRIVEGEIIHASDITTYFYGVARNVVREYWKGKNIEAARLHRFPQSNSLAESVEEVSVREFGRVEHERQLECLESCLQALPEETCQLIVVYYQGDSGAQVRIRQSLASKLGISPTALRLRIARIRAKLDGCLKRCLEV